MDAVESVVENPEAIEEGLAMPPEEHGDQLLVTPTEESGVKSAPPTPDVFLPRKLLMATLALLFFVLTVHTLDRLGPILQPLLIACFILYALHPVKNWLRRQGLPTWAAYSLILTVVLAAFLAVGALGYGNLYRLNPERLAAYEGDIDLQLNRLLRALGLATDEPVQLRDFFYSEEGLNVRVRGLMMTTAGNFFGFLGGAAVVAVYLFFMLLESAEIRQRVTEAFGERSDEILNIAGRINDSVGEYLSVIAFVSVLQGALSAAVLGLLGVDYFLLWGLLIGLCNFVPYLGLLGLVPPIVLAFLQYPEELWRPLTAAGLLILIQAVVDNLITPRLTAHKLGVSPLLVVLSLAFWGWLWGPIGLFLAVPMTATIKIILHHIDATRPVAILMKDK